MTVSTSLLTVQQFTTAATSYTTSSVTPHADRLVLCAVASESSNASSAPTVSGCGLTWVQVDTVPNASNDSLTLFRAMGTPSAGGVTADFGGVSQQGCIVLLVELAGIATSGSNGSGAVVQHKTAGPTAGVTTLQVNMDPFADAGNATFGAFKTSGGGSFTTYTAGSGFTIVSQNSSSSPANSIVGEFVNSNDTSVDVTVGATREIFGIAIEVAAAPPAPPERSIPRGECRGLLRGVAA